jgi:hypothetical protein
MAYIRDYNSYKKFRKEEKVNEEILAKIFGFLKGLFKKAADELRKLGENPSIDQVGNYIGQNPINPKDDGFIFKNKLEEFNKLPEANEQACLDLIKDILDPTEGILGTKGLQPLYDTLLATFGKDVPTLEIVKWYFEKIRNKAIKDYKYAGGPDLQVIAKKDAVIDVNKIKNDMKDQTHLPEFKKAILPAGQDGKKRKQLAYDWVTKILCVRLQAYQKQIQDDPNTEKAIDEYLKAFGKEAPEEAPIGGYKAGDSVMYKRDNWEKNKAGDVWDKLTDDEKKKPNEGKLKELIDNESIGIKVIKAVEKDFVRFTDVDWIKDNDEILGKVEAKTEGQDDLVNTLKDVKTKNPEAIKKIDKIAKFYEDPDKNEDKIAKIDKIIAEEEGEG